MTITNQCTVKVQLTSLRAALGAVLPHAKRTKTGEDIALHRVRLTLANSHLFVTATNGTTTALARMTYTGGTDGDTRGNLWDPDDAPILFDLLPAEVRLARTWLQPKAVGDDEDMLVSLTTTRDGESEWEAIGTANEGSRHVFAGMEISESFPDLVELNGRAVAEAPGESSRSRDLVQDGATLALFKAASAAYNSPLCWRPTGGDNGGFVVTCGSAFAGTVASDTGGDEGKRRRADDTQLMLNILKPRAVQSA